MTSSSSETEDSCSSEYSTDSSEEDGMETMYACGTKLQIPQGLCERQDIFNEFFTVDLWNSFSDDDKEHLQSFLPNFPGDEYEEKTKTLQRLFDFENFHFSNPLVKFFEHLKAGYLRPEIAQIRQILNKKEIKEAKYRHKIYRNQLKVELLESQSKLLGLAKERKKQHTDEMYLYDRTKKCYFQTLSAIKAKVDEQNVSSDENHPEGPCHRLTRKQKRHLNSIKNGLVKKKLFNSTMDTKINGSIDLEKYITSYQNPFYINDESYKNLLSSHRKRKLEHCDDQELDVDGMPITNIINRTRLPFIKNLQIKSPQVEPKSIFNRKRIKKEPMEIGKSIETPPMIFVPVSKPNSILANNNNVSSNSESDCDSIIDILPLAADLVNEIKIEEIKHELIENVEETIEAVQNVPQLSQESNNNPISLINYGEITPIKMEDLETIDIMNTPIELDNSEIDVLNIKPELMQDTHANFFSLIRDVICSTNEHRMNMYTLQERLKAWQKNPISPLNDWYNYILDWINILPSAITFLCGNASEQPDDFVPYMEYKTPLDVYQWIGAGRDSDQLLSNLCTFWLQHRSESKMTKPVEVEMDISDKDTTPHPPRCPTTWTVRKATPEDVRSYREQERRRYDNPHKAFTYRCNGYESVVGPLKGIYYPASANSKARGHTMLNADRPNFVTILSLVRDATARLPNGEGTRADICELLKSSQYISNTAPENVLQSVVSGALDRMHTQWDPCVKYDQKRKIWIYLHRHRSEDDFERIHQHFQGVQKVKKNARKSPAKPKTPKAEKPKSKPQKVAVANNIVPQQVVIKLENEPKIDEIKEEIVVVDNNVAEQQEVAKITKTKRQSLYQPKLAAVDNKILMPSLVPTTPSKGTSLLISNNPPKHLQEVATPIKKLEPLDQDKQLRVASPLPKGSVVKIMTPTQGKSIIVPTSNPQILKQVPERPKKAQIKQPSAARQTKKKTITTKGTIELPEGESLKQLEKGKIPASIHQQIVQGLTTQQLQNIKNVTLLRTPTSEVQKDVSIPSTDNVQLKTTASLTTAQTQQILQTIKQKYLPNSNVLTPQQQVLLKQKGCVVQLQKPVVATTKNNSTSEVASNQVPMVAKVLTNAAGQVISVESLLAHQKTHGSLPQGTTLRVQSSKGQQNLIHLTSTTKPNSTIAHFTVGTQNNLVALTTQPKLVVTSQTTTVTTSVTQAKPQSSRSVSRTHQASKASNTKMVADVQKATPQTKVVPPQTKVVPLKVPNAKAAARTANFTSSLRMLNTANLNLTTLDGKPVLLASKTGLQSLHGQNVLVQAHPGTNQTGSSLVLQGAVTKKPSSQSSVLNQTSSIVFSSAIKNQIPQQVLFSSQGVKGGTTTPQPGHLVLNNQPIRLQAGTPAGGQRVVLASQGQGGQILAQQILLPAGFQGTAINIKSLQGVKVIPLAQTQKGQSRQIVAKVMSPGLVKTTQAAPVQLQQESVTIHSSESE